MNYSIFYQQKAVDEYEEAVTWYKERSIQAAENFEAAVKEKIDVLRSNATHYRKTHKEFREIKLHKYPFNIIYLVDEIKFQVIISSIFHHKRNPRNKFRKLK